MPSILPTAVIDLALVVALGCSAWGIGSCAGVRSAREFARLEGLLTGLAIGLAVLSVVLFGIGQLHLLTTATIVAALVPGWAVALWHWLRPTGPEVATRPGPRFEGSERWILIAAGPAVLLAFAATLVPEWFYDALYSHTAFPALFLLRGGIEVFPHAVHSAMPASVNVLFLPLLDLGSATTVKLAHFAFWLGSAGWVLLLARRHAGPTAGVAAAAVFVSLPGPAVMAGVGAVDHGATFFVLGALYLVFSHPVPGDLHREVFAAGLLLGAAAAAKYTVLLPGGILGTAVVLHLVGRSRQRLWCSLGWFTLGVLVIAGPWYVRNLLVLGNPVYPLLEELGSAGALAVANLRLDSGPPYAMSRLFHLPIDLVGERGGFGAGSEFWPSGVLLFPALFWALFRRGFWRWAAVASVFIVVVWSQGPLIARYLYPVIAVMCAMAGAMFFSPGRSRVARGLATTAVAVLGVLGAVRAADVQQTLYGGPLPTIVGSLSAEEFLAARVQHWPAADWVRRRTDPHRTKLLFVGETAGYYFQRDYEPISAYDTHPITGWLGRSASPADLLRDLKAHGFSHIVWNPSELSRLQRRYDHLPLGSGELDRFRRLLAECDLRFSASGVTVYQLP